LLGLWKSRKFDRVNLIYPFADFAQLCVQFALTVIAQSVGPVQPLPGIKGRNIISVSNWLKVFIVPVNFNFFIKIGLRNRNKRS
jgi:hypothetical protein